MNSCYRSFAQASFVYSYVQTRLKGQYNEKWPLILVYVLKPLIIAIRAIDIAFVTPRNLLVCPKHLWYTNFLAAVSKKARSPLACENNPASLPCGQMATMKEKLSNTHWCAFFFFTFNGTEYEHVVSIICFFPFFLVVIKTKEKYFGLLLQTSFNKSPSFQVAVCLSLKASLGAKLLKRKWVWSFGLWMSFCHIPQGQIQHFLKVGAEQEY